MQNKQAKLLTLALKKRKIALAILGQALIDEGSIGERITISYVSREEGEYLWKIANALGYANPLRTKDHKTHNHWWFSIKASKIKELYNEIGPLPNSFKDEIFRHHADRSTDHLRPRGETRKLILEALKENPKTKLQVMLKVKANESIVRKHLNQLKQQGLIRIQGRNHNALHRGRRTALLWTTTEKSTGFNV